MCFGDYAVIMHLYIKEPQWWVTVGDTSLSSLSEIISAFKYFIVWFLEISLVLFFKNFLAMLACIFSV